MTSIIKKTKKGKVYYYAAQSGRVNGKPRITWQKYLGTVDNIMQRLDRSNEPIVKEVDIFQAGGTAAFLRIAESIDMVKIIDKIVPKRDQGPSVGEYILVAALNRIVGPCSKASMPEWYQKNVLSRLWKYRASDFDSQSFWNHMDLISEASIEEIQDKVAAAVIHKFKLDPKGLLYDTTNFFTYIATGNDRNTVAKRGRNKQKRDDLRQVGMALLVTDAFHIPLFHRTYNGNRPDQGLFPEMAGEICESAKRIFKTSCNTTLAFDKGNIAENAMETLAAAGQHIVAGIPKDMLPDPFSTPIEELKHVIGLSGTQAKSWSTQMWDINVKVVLAYSESYFISQLADATARIQKAEQQLKELNSTIAKWSRKPNYRQRPTNESVQKQVKAIISTRYVNEVIEATVEEHNGLPFVRYATDKSKLDSLIKTDFGRTMIISTRLNWTEKEIISTYRGLNTIESSFRLMKNRDCLHWQPAFHWTDQKIKVHSLYCVLALLLVSLANKIVVESGIDLSVPEMIDELEDIREVALIYAKESKPQKNQVVLSKMSPRQRKIAQILEIEQVLGR